MPAAAIPAVKDPDRTTAAVASASSAKSMWASVVAGLNREQAQPQQTTK